MPITVINAAGIQMGGYELYEEVEGEAQFSIYASIQQSIAPFLANVPIPAPNFIPCAVIKGYMSAKVISYDPLYLSLFEGYPQRFNLGAFRYLQGNFAAGKPRYIDSLQWVDSTTMKLWVTQSGFPNFSFPPSVPPPLVQLLTVIPLINGNDQDGFSGHTAADGFAYSLTKGVIMSFSFQYQATAVILSGGDAGSSGIFLISI